MNRPSLGIVHLNSMLTGGGTDDQCVKLARGLSQLQQRVTLIGPDGREFSGIARQLGVPFHASPPEGLLKVRFVLEAAKFVRKHSIQIIHGHHGRDLWPAVMVARLCGRRASLVVTRHLAKSPSSWPSRRFLLSQCDGLIAVSEFVARVLREGVYEPEAVEPERRSRPPLQGDHAKIQVIHPGIDTDRFRPAESSPLRQEWGLPQEAFVFAVVGGYELPRGKGQREFLRAAATVHQTIPRARFLIIGRGGLKETLQQDIARLGLQGKAWLTPYCQDMPAAMNAVDCLVHPQVGTEAFGAVVLEAFACGKPVIASALDGVTEAFAAGQQGRLVRPEDVNELAAAMVAQAGCSPLEMRERLALHERVASTFSLEQLARKVLDYYSKLLGRN